MSSGSSGPLCPCSALRLVKGSAKCVVFVRCLCVCDEGY